MESGLIADWLLNAEALAVPGHLFVPLNINKSQTTQPPEQINSVQ